MYIQEDFISPHTITVLCTYQCTAACRQCCFESSPSIKGRLSLGVIKARILEAKQEFPSLQLVAFSGGEVSLLKDDLYAAISYANGLGLMTRIVTNGSWGKTKNAAKKTARSLKQAGLNELNISTGKDHQEWVPAASVINAAEEAVNQEIPTLITVESDSNLKDCTISLTSNERIRKMISERRLVVQSNSWMPFHSDAEDRSHSKNEIELRSGCDQIFKTMVVTPHDNLSACCGLTLEHIPEMRLGKNDGSNIADLYKGQADDFLKYWISVDGPARIIERLIGEQARYYLKDVVHICQACVILHKNPEIKNKLLTEYEKFVPDVMTRFFVKEGLLKYELGRFNA